MTPQEAAAELRNHADNTKTQIQGLENSAGPELWAAWQREITALEMGAAALEQATCPHCGAERETADE